MWSTFSGSNQDQTNFMGIRKRLEKYTRLPLNLYLPTSKFRCIKPRGLIMLFINTNRHKTKQLKRTGGTMVIERMWTGKETPKERRYLQLVSIVLSLTTNGSIAFERGSHRSSQCTNQLMAKESVKLITELTPLRAVNGVNFGVGLNKI